ncbi:MAG TPA: Na-translocating system protein MpsB, partial [Alphaproteobacteria bacterium]|nr:Na-translocating system protein MpsB [Alphaproteobacteria bacterium]
MTDKPLSAQAVDQIPHPATPAIEDVVRESWKRIAPTWPLKNLIAVNPLAGFEDLPFEQALHQGNAYFQQKDFPPAMHAVNRHTIKWLQTFFDQGQATIQMPLRQNGLFASIHQLLRFDSQLTKKGSKNRLWLENLSTDPKKVIAECLEMLRIPPSHQANFITLLLSTLSGWAAYIAYWNDWTSEYEAKNFYPASKTDYLALRLVLTCLIWPNALELLAWDETGLKKSNGHD